MQPAKKSGAGQLSRDAAGAGKAAGARGRSPSGSREKILDAAEQLFAQHGYEACSFRMISEKSGINQGLLHYHFGSKQNLFSEVFLRRARELVERRMTLLDAAEAQAEGKSVPIDTLVRCFIEPPLRMLQGSLGDRAFARIHSQLRSDPVEFGLELRRKAFGNSTQRYVDAMRRACPHLSAEAVSWRFNSMIGAYLVVISQGGRIEDLSRGLCDSKDIDAAILHIVPFLVAAFEAPDPNRPAAAVRAPQAAHDSFEGSATPVGRSRPAAARLGRKRD